MIQYYTIYQDRQGKLKCTLVQTLVQKFSASLYSAWFYNDVHIYRLHFSSSTPVSVKPIDIVYDQPQQTTQ